MDLINLAYTLNTHNFVAFKIYQDLYLELESLAVSW